MQEAPAFDSNEDITPEYGYRVHGYFGLELGGSRTSGAGTSTTTPLTLLGKATRTKY